MPPKNRINPLIEKFKQSGALFASADLPRVVEIDLVNLRPNPDQSRTIFDDATLRELAESIAQHGLIQPISIAPDPDRLSGDGYIIVAGERRYRAHQLLQRTTIPAIITSGNPAEIAVIENLQRENLRPLEEAQALNNLMQKHGYTQAVVSQVVGKARNTVTSLLRLMTLPQRIQDECPTSDVSKSALIELARIDNPDEQLALWEDMKHGSSKTVRAARASKKHAPSVQQNQSPSAPVLKAGAGFVRQLRKVVSGKVLAGDELVTQLRDIHNQINGLLQEVDTQLSSVTSKSESISQDPPS
jgi:ParB family transcriptional regulator, chromosome partitioning protein